MEELLVTFARASGLDVFEYLLLIRAAEGDGVVTRDVGRALGLNTSTTTGLADRLEHQTLIRRYPHPVDRRLRVLKATPKGQATIGRTLGTGKAELAELFDTLGPAELVTAERLVDAIALVFKQQTHAARDHPDWPGPPRAASPP